MQAIRQIEKKDIFRHSLVIGIALLSSYLISNIISMLFMYVFLNLGYSRNELSSVIMSFGWGYLINTICAAVSFVFPFLLILKVFKLDVGKTCSFGKPNNTAVYCIFFVLLLTFLANVITNNFILFFENNFGYSISQANFGESPDGSFRDLLYLIICSAAAPALLEEFAFRGVLLGSIRKFGDLTAIFVSSLLFALLHGNFVQIPFAFIVGVGLALTVVITGSIWPAIIIHFINNSIAVVSQYYSKYMGFYFLFIIAAGIGSFIWLIVTRSFKDFENPPSTFSGIQRFFKMFNSPTVVVYVLGMLWIATKFVK